METDHTHNSWPTVLAKPTNRVSNRGRYAVDSISYHPFDPELPEQVPAPLLGAPASALLKEYPLRMLGVPYECALLSIRGDHSRLFQDSQGEHHREGVGVGRRLII